jgi:hypothetical protein
MTDYHYSDSIASTHAVSSLLLKCLCENPGQEYLSDIIENCYSLMIKTAHTWVVMLENNLIFQVLQKEFSSLLNYLSPYIAVLSFQFELAKPWITLVLFVSFLTWLAFWLVKIYVTWLESKRLVTIFEVLPPTSTEQSSYTTTQLFSSVYGLLRQRKLDLSIARCLKILCL